MVEAAALCMQYVDGVNKVDFMCDKHNQQAVTMNLIILGEAATAITNNYGDFANANPQIPRQSLKGMRNRIAHGYFDINLETVWETIKMHLPKLVEQLKRIAANSASLG